MPRLCSSEPHAGGYVTGMSQWLCSSTVSSFGWTPGLPRSGLGAWDLGGKGLDPGAGTRVEGCGDTVTKSFLRKGSSPLSQGKPWPRRQGDSRSISHHLGGGMNLCRASRDYKGCFKATEFGKGSRDPLPMKVMRRTLSQTCCGCDSRERRVMLGY